MPEFQREMSEKSCDLGGALVLPRSTVKSFVSLYKLRELCR